MTPLVSVVIPTYNQCQFIGEAISSVLNQTFGNFEIIVVDNFSTDDTERVVRTFDDPRLRYFRFANHGVIAAGRNRGVAESRGTLIAFLDSDDAWDCRKLERQLPLIEDQQVSLVATDFIPMGDVAHTKRHLFFRPHEQYRDYDYEQVLLGNPVMTSSVVVRKNEFLKLGGFDEARTFCFIEDWELWLRMVREKPLRVMAARLLNYRTAFQANRDMRKVTLNYLSIFEKHLKMGMISEADFKRGCGNSYVTIGKAFLDKNDPKALHYYWKALRESSGRQNKLRAFAGVCLACMPRFVRVPLLETHYLLHSRGRKTGSIAGSDAV